MINVFIIHIFILVKVISYIYKVTVDIVIYFICINSNISIDKLIYCINTFIERLQNSIYIILYFSKIDRS